MVVVLIEKLAPFGAPTRMLNAVALTAAAVWFLVR
jgi:hypothetical protein